MEYILNVVQRRWGADYAVVTSDGLLLEDSPATQGLAFWKCPRRKLYAVTKKDIQNGTPLSSSKRPILLDSDDEDFEPMKKKSRQKLDLLLNEVENIRETLDDMMTLTEDTRVPMGLKRILRDTFKCHICHSVPIKPPVIVTKCCKNILGCESCINTWYSGPDALVKTCPACRAERGYNETMLLRGLDEFLKQIGRVIQTEEEREEDSVPAVLLD